MPSLNSAISTSIFALVAIPFLIIAVVFVVLIARSNRKVRASMNWSTTTGRILLSEVTSYRHRDADGITSTLYQPTIQYEYVVNGQHLQSNHVRFGMAYGTSWTGSAQNVVDKYPQGTLVQVFYNPTNPTEAVLEHSAGGSNRILTCVVAIIVGVLLITGAGLFLMNGFLSQIMKLVPHF